MSAPVEEQSDDAMADSLHQSQDAVSDMGDRSSSLSDIEDKEAEADEPEDHDDQDEADEHDDIDGVESGEESASEVNDSEAETERLDESPQAQLKRKDVILTSNAESQTFTKSPSKLQQQYSAAEEMENAQDELSGDDVSIDTSPKSRDLGMEEQEPKAETTAFKGSSADVRVAANGADQNNKKRKRSLATTPGSVEVADIDEPARKRTGSIGVTADEYLTGDNISAHDEAETSNPLSGDISEVDSADLHADDEDATETKEAEGPFEDDAINSRDESKGSASKSDGKMGRKHHDSSINGVEIEKQADNLTGAGDDDVEEAEDMGDNEAEDAEAALKNEEEQRKKKVAMDRLGDIEQHFASFRDRLHEERLALLDREEWMLRQDPPTHPQYLAMLQCIDARRDEKLKIEERLIEFRRESIERSAVARRSQIFGQFYQEVRDIREKTLESLGKQWYEIQHERRGYGSNVEDYAIKFPTKRSQQLKNQYAYNTEVSVLSGIAKYVGFPAAPPMSSATSAELDQDLEKMGKSHHKTSTRSHQALPLQDLAALRAATTGSSYKPAEEQFIESTPWANPQHPSHAHLLQRQSSTHQQSRIESPFSSSNADQPSKSMHQSDTGISTSGKFTIHGSGQPINRTSSSGDHGSPRNQFSNPPHLQSQRSPLPGRKNLSPPQQNRQSLAVTETIYPMEDMQSATGINISQPANISAPRDATQGFTYDPGVPVKREQSLLTGGRFSSRLD